MPRPDALLPGSFNPLHAGHLTLAVVAGRVLGVPVEFELSTVNVDKPELAKEEVERRRVQFSDVGKLWVTRAATFAEKSILFPGTSFVIGYDTATRLIDPKYYSGDPLQRDRALDLIRDRGNRIVVGGRLDCRNVFCEWNEAEVSYPYHSLFIPLSEADFRVDLSSSELRERLNSNA